MRALTLLTLGTLLALPPGPARAGDADADDDLAAARAVFEANLDAIRARDRDAYLATYLDAPTLARTGAGGISLGYESHAAAAGEGWPDHFDARALELVPVRPGVVYGTYRYRVRYGDDEQRGLSERVFIETGDGWKIAVTTAFAEPSGTAPPPLALLGATLVDGTGADPVADSAVLVRDGRIECAGPRADCPVPEDMERIDLAGRFLTPGLVDAHVHFSQTGWADGRPDSLDLRRLHPYEETQADLRADPERFFRSLLCSGITAVFDVGGYPWTWGLRARAETDSRAPRVAASGPLLSTLDFWLNLPAERQFIHLADPDAARAGVDYLAAHQADAVKVWFIPVRDPEREPTAYDDAVRAAGAAARARELPLIVHATDLREARVAVEAGAHLLVHSVWDREVDDAFLAAAKARGTIYCPTLTVARGYLRQTASAANGEPPEIDDPNGCVDPEIRDRVRSTAKMRDEIDPERLAPDRLVRGLERIAERERIGAANLRRVHDAGIEIAMGTDAGNPLTLHGPSVHAELEAMEAAGLDPMTVIVAATRGGARAMGRGDELGTVEAGKHADLLVLRADPTATVENFRQLEAVVRGGELRPLAELRRAP